MDAHSVGVGQEVAVLKEPAVGTRDVVWAEILRVEVNMPRWEESGRSLWAGGGWGSTCKQGPLGHAGPFM